MGACETLGLLKMDFLGLRNLTVLDDCLRNIEANRGETVVLEDARRSTTGKAYELLARGDTLGVFQLDGGPMRALLRSMQPTTSRTSPRCSRSTGPGPMGANAHNDYADRKNGRKPVVPIHPELAEPLAEILGDTYGLIVYQEQVMAIAQKLAGYTLGQADLLRRAMGKKKKEILDKEYVPFSDGMRAQRLLRRGDQDAVGHPRPVLRLRLQQGAHRGLRPGVLLDGVPQGQLPGRVHGGAAHLRPDDKDKSALYLNECRRMGIKVLPPDVNESDADFTPRGTDIRFGLSAIRNVGDNVVGVHRRDPRGQGPVRRLRRLPAQGRRRSPATRRSSSR